MRHSGIASVKARSSSGVGLCRTSATWASLRVRWDPFARGLKIGPVYRTGRSRPWTGPPPHAVRNGTMDVTEDELLSAIRKVLAVSASEVIVGVGDDAAVVRPGAGDLVLTTDALVEGSHFVAAEITPHDLGYRAIVVNVSDVAAMAASPRYALCALTLSEW